MTLKTFVKVGNISNLSDARYCAGFGVDLLGFDINPNSKGYINLETVGEIMGWIEGSDFVAECGDMSINAIKDVINTEDIPFLQVNDLSVANALIAEEIKVIFQLVISADSDLTEISNSLDELSTDLQYFVIECENPELTETLDQVISALDTSVPIIRSYGIEQGNLETILNHPKINGIELKGSHEEHPGLKTYDDLADILEELEVED